MKKERRFSVELTEKQLRLIANCVEDCHRFAGGQVELWNTTSLLENYSDIEDVLRKQVKNLVTPDLPYGASYCWNGGRCPNDYQRRFIAETYPIYREIRHYFALLDNQDNVYTSSTLTCEDGGEPIKITLKEQ